jgi:2,5-dihydroxypyridine 5,6-dioxygenase
MLPVSVSRRVVVECLHLAPGERLTVVTDESPGHELVLAIAAAARSAGAQVAVLGAERVPAHPHGYLTWRSVDPVVAAAIRASDVVVFFASTLLALTDDVRAAAATGTRMLFVPADLDLRRPFVLEEDLDELTRLGAAVAARLVSAHRVRVSTRDGTELTMAASGTVSYDDCQVRAAGQIDFFPGGMWTLVPDPATVDGLVRFPATLYPVGRLAEPVDLRFEAGHVTEVSGGWQATAWRRWLESFGETEAMVFAHLSGGLAARAQVIGHDWEDLVVRGSLLIAGGANVLYGGTTGAPAHFDAIVPNASLELDGRAVLTDGRYDPDLLQLARGAA